MKNINGKKKILIIMPYMKMGGVETSLLRILKFLDYSNIEVTLLLTKTVGPLLDKVPNNVEVKEMKFNNKMAELLVANFKNQATLLQRLARKIYRKFINIKGYISKSKENQIFEYCLRYVEPEKVHYDLAIDFHGYGFFTTAYTAKKVNSEKKITWIHDENMDFLKDVSSYLSDFDKFFGVANSCVNIFKNKYPEYKERVDILYNIIDVDDIIGKSKEEIDDRNFNGEFKIVTVGRLTEQKGYDLAIDAAQIIKDLGYNFSWYVIGDGKLKNELEDRIKKNGLLDNFKLLGIKSNPFPYIKGADLYVQPSRNEGYGLAIAEARILKKPIIATRIDCVMEQITDNVNGYLVNLNVSELAEKIMELIDKPEKREYVVNNLGNEPNDYLDQLEKVYSIL